jgi:hypothetical protein
MNQMSNSNQQVFGSAPPPGNPNQYQQVNAHGQAPGTTPPQVQQQGTPNVQHPAQHFLRQMMPSSGVHAPEQREVLFHNGNAYYKASEHKTHYKCSQQKTEGKSSGALVDGGTTAGFGGDDVLVIEWTDRKADVTGIDAHKLDDLPIVTCLGLIMTTRGAAIAVMYQYAYYGKGKTIHPPRQMGHFGHDVNDKSVKLPDGTGKQQIITPEGYIIPLNIVDGLLCMKMTKSTQEDRKLPHIILSSDMEWDPRYLDHIFVEYTHLFYSPCALTS